jgi:3-oxoacyl-[acyl-carrier protein] reductase
MSKPANKVAIITGASKGIGASIAKHFAAEGTKPLGRRGRPEDIAKAVVFLASCDAAWITGEQISVSGGMYGF